MITLVKVSFFFVVVVGNVATGSKILTKCLSSWDLTDRDYLKVSQCQIDTICAASKPNDPLQGYLNF